MATKNFRSTVLEPTSEFAYGDKLRFTALATVGEVLKGSFSETTIGEDGVYSVDLQYGKHRIDYKPYEGVWRHFADVEVNSDTLATTLQDLALASVPVTDDVVLVLQGILADAEAAKTAAESAEDASAAALASIDATIDDAKAGYPDVVRAMFSSTVYVDSVNGDDTNSGATLALAKKTIKSAIESSPSGSSVKVLLSDQRHVIDQSVSVAGRRVEIAAISGAPEIEQMQNISSASYASFRFLLSSNSAIIITGCKVITASMTSVKIGVLASSSNAMFMPNGYGASVKIIGCDVDLGSSPLAHVHIGGSLEGATDLYLVSTQVALSSASTVAADDRLLVGSYGTGGFPQVVMFYSVTNSTGLAWSDLISANSMLQTNIVMTMNHNNAEYINFDAESAGDADIVAAFDAALADQQAKDLFESEKNIALQIMSDFNLGTGDIEITGADIADVRAYIQSIDPAKGLKAGHLQRAKIPRPSVFDRYKKNPYEL